jgi:membrane protein YdbS with pleckstrin-like domain
MCTRFYTMGTIPVIFDTITSMTKSKNPNDTSFISSPTGLFSYFVEKPTTIRFETQQEQEEIILFLRPHIITNLPWVVFTVILFFAPMLIWPFLFATKALPFAIPLGYGIVMTTFWYVVVFGFVVTSFLHWYFNIYIVTNQRIVDIDFIQLLYRKFSAASLNRIQDITYTQSGFIRTLFDHGDVYIQTAGTTDNFDFLDVPHPQNVVDTITKLLKVMGVKLKVEKEGTT